VHVERWTAPTGKERVLVRMDALMSARYARAARLAVPRALAGPSGYGSARGPDRPPAFASERRAWRAALVRAAEPGAVAEIGDVAACYPSIGERALRAAARAAGGDPRPVLSFLREVRPLGVSGLPIGPVPSSFLADAVLSLADRVAAQAGVPPVRWVDDVVFAGDREAVARAAGAWRRALADLGLAHHEGKRRWATDTAALVTRAGLAPSMAQGAGRGIIRL
jgi:hypothetical protein